MLTDKLRNFIKNLNPLEKKKKTVGKPTTRVCTNCEEEKPLDKDHFQFVKHFKYSYSYYCNECNKPKPRD